MGEEITPRPETPRQQLRMVWPRHLLNTPPSVHIHPAYELRTYRPGDEAGWFTLMELAGFGHWEQARLQESTWATILPAGWFFAVHRASGELVASAMSSHAPLPLHPFGAALNWVVGHPAHTGKQLGMTVCAAVTARLLQAGYQNIYLLTDDWRWPALIIYLKLGYQPLLFAADMAERWQAICAQLAWPFTPAQWPQTEYNKHQQD
jgi:mycothiol synthase